MQEPARKSEQAFRTIGELAAEIGVPQHILRYWETRFPQLKPLQRAGNRRYYRPADVLLAQRIHRLLNQDGYTIRGVQQLLASSVPDAEIAEANTPVPDAPVQQGGSIRRSELQAIRDTLAAALAETQV